MKISWNIVIIIPLWCEDVKMENFSDRDFHWETKEVEERGENAQKEMMCKVN